MKKTIVMAAAALAVAGFASTSAMAQDAAAGEKVAKKCLACHTFDKGGAHKVGPNLFGAVHHKPGEGAEGFKFSDGFLAATAKGFEWTDENLMAYLEDPTAFLRATSGDDKARSKMTFKLKSEKERQDVIAYLKSLKD